MGRAGVQKVEVNSPRMAEISRGGAPMLQGQPILKVVTFVEAQSGPFLRQVTMVPPLFQGRGSDFILQEIQRGTQGWDSGHQGSSVFLWILRDRQPPHPSQWKEQSSAGGAEPLHRRYRDPGRILEPGHGDLPVHLTLHLWIPQ